MQFLLSLLLVRCAVSSQYDGLVVSAETPLLGACFPCDLWERSVQDIMSAGALCSALDGVLWPLGLGRRTEEGEGWYLILSGLSSVPAGELRCVCVIAQR